MGHREVAQLDSTVAVRLSCEMNPMTVLTKAQADFLIAGMRSNFQINCDICSKPLGDDRHEAAHGPFPVCVHSKCRDLLISYKLDKRRLPRHGG